MTKRMQLGHCKPDQAFFLKRHLMACRSIDNCAIDPVTFEVTVWVKPGYSTTRH